MACKEQKLISCSSGGWEVQDQGARSFSIWWGPASRFMDNCLLALTLHGERAEGAPCGLFEKNRALITHLLKAPSPNTITSGIQFQHMNFEGTQTCSL